MCCLVSMPPSRFPHLKCYARLSRASKLFEASQKTVLLGHVSQQLVPVCRQLVRTCGSYTPLQSPLLFSSSFCEPSSPARRVFVRAPNLSPLCSPQRGSHRLSAGLKCSLLCLDVTTGAAGGGVVRNRLLPWIGAGIARRPRRGYILPCI